MSVSEIRKKKKGIGHWRNTVSNQRRVSAGLYSSELNNGHTLCLTFSPRYKIQISHKPVIFDPTKNCKKRQRCDARANAPMTGLARVARSYSKQSESFAKLSWAFKDGRRKWHHGSLVKLMHNHESEPKYVNITIQYNITKKFDIGVIPALICIRGHETFMWLIFTDRQFSLSSHTFIAATGGFVPGAPAGCSTHLPPTRRPPLILRSVNPPTGFVKRRTNFPFWRCWKDYGKNPLAPPSERGEHAKLAPYQGPCTCQGGTELGNPLKCQTSWS